MKVFSTVLLGLGLVYGVSSCTPKEAVESETFTMVDGSDSLGYAYGVLMGTNFYKQAIDMNPDAVATAMKVTSTGEEGLMTYQEANAFMESFDRKQKKQEEIQALKDAKVNKEAGAKFMLDNAKRPEVTQTASGLQYEVLKAGNGKTPTLEDGVVAHYTGTLLDGTVFDSSIEKGKPMTFGVTQVIKGWTEALTSMKEGDKWKVYIPSDLAYGDRGSQAIPAGSTLIFEMELIQVLTK